MRSTQLRQLPVVLKARATYFALVFGAGFISVQFVFSLSFDASVIELDGVIGEETIASLCEVLRSSIGTLLTTF